MEYRLRMKKLIRFIERRFSQRYVVEIPVIFSIWEKSSLTEQTGYHPGILINLGRRGCCLEVYKLHIDGFYMMKCLEIADNYYIKIKIPDKNGDQVAVLGCIRYINGGLEARKQHFFIGIELVFPVNVKNFIKD